MLQIQLQICAKNKQCWLQDIFNSLNEVDIYLTLNEIKTLSISQWKKLVIHTLTNKAFENLVTEQHGKSKLSKLNYEKTSWKTQKYFSLYPSTFASVIFKTRTRMLPVNGNFSSNNVKYCEICSTFLDTQEHLYACEKFQTPTVDISTFFVDCDDDNTKENVYINAKRLIDRLQEKQPK